MALLAGRLVVRVFEMDQVEPPGYAVVGLHGGHDAAAVADGGQHSGARDGGHIPQTAISAPLSAVRLSRKVLSSQLRSSLRSKTTKCPASASQRSM